MSFFGIPIRNGLSLGLGTVASLTNGPGFLPSELYYDGTVQGAWYDPSDLTTLFQDSAGTTPVTAVEQPVGLMLDKSKGLVLGSELVTNGTFASGTTGWTLTGGGTFTASNGIARLQNPTTPLAEATVYATITTVVGRWYTFVFTLAGSSAGQTLSVRVGTSAGGTQNATSTPVAAGTYRVIFAATATTTYITLNQNVSTADVWSDWDNISVRELPGNHAYQSTSASRPTLRARYNLLTYSEDLSNAVWLLQGVAVSATAGASPLGTTAYLVYPTSSGNNRCPYQLFSAVATSITTSVYAKASGKSWVLFNGGAGFGGTGVWFNVSTGTVGTATAGYSGAIQSVGSGWFRLTVTHPAQNNLILQVNIVDANGSAAVVANGTDGVLLWGAQLTNPAVFPSNTYQRVGASTDYATGAAFPPYLFFDGTDDSMLTNSVDFSGTDKMLVVAGVTKNSDAATGIVAELSANAASNAGTFVSSAPNGAAANYGLYSRGSVAPASAANASSFAAPITNVYTGIGDIGGDLARVRVNGALSATDTSDQGTGNFGNYPLFIGSRNQASLRFNGNIYSLIIAGQSYSSGQISSTESWVAAKTPLGTI